MVKRLASIRRILRSRRSGRGMLGHGLSPRASRASTAGRACSQQAPEPGPRRPPEKQGGAGCARCHRNAGRPGDNGQHEYRSAACARPAASAGRARPRRHGRCRHHQGIRVSTAADQTEVVWNPLSRLLPGGGSSAPPRRGQPSAAARRAARAPGQTIRKIPHSTVGITLTPAVRGPLKRRCCKRRSYIRSPPPRHPASTPMP